MGACFSRRKQVVNTEVNNDIEVHENKCVAVLIDNESNCTVQTEFYTDSSDEDEESCSFQYSYSDDSEEMLLQHTNNSYEIDVHASKQLEQLVGVVQVTETVTQQEIVKSHIKNENHQKGTPEFDTHFYSNSNADQSVHCDTFIDTPDGNHQNKAVEDSITPNGNFVQIHQVESQCDKLSCDIPDYYHLKQKLIDAEKMVIKLQRSDDELKQNNQMLFDELQRTKINNVFQEEKKVQKPSIPIRVRLKKQLVQTILPDVIEEKFDDLESYMRNFEILYPKQVLKQYNINNGIIGIANYNLHFKQTHKQLYIVCERIHKSDVFKQTNEICTDAMLQKMYNIHFDQLPQVLPNSIPIHLVPNNQQIKTMKNLLTNKNNRHALIARKDVRWTNGKIIPIHQSYKGKKSEFFTLKITQEAFIKKLETFSESMENVQLIPIIQIEGDRKYIEYCWVVYIETNSGNKFHIGISLIRTNDNIGLKPSAIYMSIYDKHKLIQIHDETKQCAICCHQFVQNPNKIEIGKITKEGTMHQVQQLIQNNVKLKKDKKQLKRRNNMLEQENNDHQRTINALQIELNKNKQLKDQQQTINALHQQLNYVLEQNQTYSNSISKLLGKQGI
eukprot:287053_1